MTRYAVCTSKHMENHTQIGGHNIQVSSPDLAFFEDNGPGSERATKVCANCHFFDVAHANHPSYSAGFDEKGIPRTTCKCLKFEPHGPYDFDFYYDGCRGWD